MQTVDEAPNVETSKLPKQVQAAAERARQFLEQHNPDQVAEVKVVTPEPKVETPVETKADLPPVDPRENDLGYWKHLAKTREGIIKRERERHQNDLADRDLQIDGLKEQVRQLEAAKPLPPVDVSTYFSQEEIDRMGEDQARIMANRLANTEASVTKKAREIAEQTVEPLKKKAKEKEENDSKSAFDRMLVKLGELVPEWEEINKSEGWQLWLQDVDSKTGVERQELIEIHQRKLSAEGLAKMLNEYMASLKPASVPPAPPVVPQGNASAGNPAVVSAPNKGYPTPDEIKEHFKLRALNKVSQKERDEFNARLNAAQS